MTFPPDAADEPVHPDVRSMLWRLRARLVSPPDEHRAADDLDRIFAAAHEHAHGDDVPVPAPVEATPTRLTPVGVLQPAPKADVHSRIYAFTRVAAAAVLVVAVGGGIATARDGVVIDALLGRIAPSGSGGQLALPIDPVGLDGDVDAVDLPEPTPVPLVDLDGREGDGVPDPTDDSADDASADDTDTDAHDAGAVDSSDSGEVADDPDQGGQASNGGSSTGSAPTPAPSAPAPAPSDDPVDEVEDGVDDAPTDEIIAAPAPPPPPPRDVDGFSGPDPCREDQTLRDCLAEREAVNDADDADEPAESGSDDSTAGDEQDPVSEQEKLARRRGGG